MEDAQSSALGSAPAAKLGGTRNGPDAQSVTKRYACSRLARSIPCYHVEESHVLIYL